MTTIEAYGKSLREFFGKPCHVVTGNCLAFGGETIRFRSHWVIIGDNSYPHENPLHLLEALKTEGVIKVSDYAMTAFPNRVQNLITNNQIQWQAVKEK